MLLIGTFMMMSNPPVMAARPTGWTVIARSADGSTLQYDKSTLQRSADQRAVWLRVDKGKPDARKVKTSTFLVWLNCKTRLFNLMLSRDDDVSGTALAQRSYGGNGKGFEPVRPETAVANAMLVVCR